MPTRIQYRRGNATDWTSINPILNQGEPGYELDTHLSKVGDGISTWNTLPYSSASYTITSVSSSYLNPFAVSGSSITRSLSDRFTDVINVKDFGATGDGVTDDTAAIQAAIDIAENGSGSIIVNFPVGQYIISTIRIKSAHLRGVINKGFSPRGSATILFHKIGATDDMIVIEDVNTADRHTAEIDGFVMFGRREHNLKNPKAIVSVSDRLNFFVAPSDVPSSSSLSGSFPYYGHCFFFSDENRFMGHGVVQNIDTGTGQITLMDRSDNYATYSGSAYLLDNTAQVCFSPLRTENWVTPVTFSDSSGAGYCAIRYTSRNGVINKGPTLKNLLIWCFHAGIVLGYNTNGCYSHIRTSYNSLAGIATADPGVSYDGFYSDIFLSGFYSSDMYMTDYETRTFDNSTYRVTAYGWYGIESAAQITDFVSDRNIIGAFACDCSSTMIGNVLIDNSIDTGLLISDKYDNENRRVIINTMVIRALGSSVTPPVTTNPRVAIRILGFGKIGVGELTVMKPSSILDLPYNYLTEINSTNAIVEINRIHSINGISQYFTGSCYPSIGVDYAMMLDPVNSKINLKTNYSKLGPELVTNGTFDTNINGWGGIGGIHDFDLCEWSASSLHISQSVTHGPYNTVSSSVVLTPGRQYFYSFNVTPVVSSSDAAIMVFEQGSNTIIYNIHNYDRTISSSFIASDDSNNTIRFKALTSSLDYLIDNVSIRTGTPTDLIIGGSILGAVGATGSSATGISIDYNGQVTINSITGSLHGTASYVISASYALNGGGSGIVSGGSYNISASYASQSLSASYTQTSSVLVTYTQSSSFASSSISSSYPWNITGSNIIFPTGSVGIGVANPVQALEVNANIKCNSTILLSSINLSNALGLYAAASANSASVYPTTTGTLIARSVGDSNPVLKVTNNSVSSTGDLVQFNSGSTKLSYINSSGVFNGTSSFALTASYLGTINSLTFNTSSVTQLTTASIDFFGNNYQLLSISSSTYFTGSNYGVGKQVALKVSNSSSLSNLYFPTGWIFLGAAAPTALSASKTAVLSLTSYGNTDSNIIATYACQI